jgi:flagellar motor switch protein FliM
MPATEKDRRPGTAASVDTAPALYAFGKFLSAFAREVAGYLSAPVSAAEGRVVRQSRREALRHTGAGGYTVAYSIKPGVERGFLVLGRQFAGWAAEVLLGAPAAVAGQPREHLTDLERHSIDSLLDILPGLLDRAFGELFGVTFSRASDIGRAPASDDEGSVLVFTADLTFIETPSEVALILPEHLADGSQPVDALQREQDRRLLLEALARATVDVEVVLKGSDMRLGDLMRLRPGMVLALPHKAGATVDCQVNGVTKFRGEMTRSAAGPGLLIQSVTPAAVHGMPVSQAD